MIIKPQKTRNNLKSPLKATFIKNSHRIPTSKFQLARIHLPLNTIVKRMRKAISHHLLLMSNRIKENFRALIASLGIEIFSTPWNSPIKT